MRKYRITLSETQAATVQNALEEFFRLRMGQDYTLSDDMAGPWKHLTPDSTEYDEKFSSYIQRRDSLHEVMRAYFRIAYGPGGAPDKKTDEMEIAECIWDAIRFKRGQSRWPDVLQVGSEPVPKVEVIDDGKAEPVL